MNKKIKDAIKLVSKELNMTINFYECKTCGSISCGDYCKKCEKEKAEKEEKIYNHFFDGLSKFKMENRGATDRVYHIRRDQDDGDTRVTISLNIENEFINLNGKIDYPNGEHGFDSKFYIADPNVQDQIRDFVLPYFAHGHILVIVNELLYGDYDMDIPMTIKKNIDWIKFLSRNMKMDKRCERHKKRALRIIKMINKDTKNSQGDTDGSTTTAETQDNG
jgi:hypothetical protein